MSELEPLLHVQQVRIAYPIGGGWRGRRHWRTAVQDVDLSLHPGESLALVGESGCGKTTLARAICGLVPVQSGRIRIAGESIGSSTLRHRQQVQLVFQDPYSALDPRLPVADQIAEPLRNFQLCPKAERRAQVDALLDRVGLDASAGDRYPHAFSGGQRQRIVIARALAAQPRLLICDEAVSALDVSVQARILDLLAQLRHELQLTLLFITHDLAVANQVAERVAVMHDGRIVEEGHVLSVFRSPQQAYTRRLLAAVPRLPVA